MGNITNHVYHLITNNLSDYAKTVEKYSKNGQ